MRNSGIQPLERFKYSRIIKEMRRILFITVALIFQITLSTAQLIRRIDESHLTCDSIELKIKYLMNTANVSGVAVSVFNDNEPVFSKTFGFSDLTLRKPLEKTSVLYAASFSKTVFAYIVMQLIQEKLIDLDRPLIQYLNKPLPDYIIKGWNRGYQDLKGDERYKLITARMCLTHTTGFPNWRWFESDRKLKFIYDPGQRYNYSGEGLYLLQFAIEQLTGKDFESIANERVFKPFGMISTSYVWQSRFNSDVCYGHNNAGEKYELMKWKEASDSGSLSTTLDDYTRFYKALISGNGLSQGSFDTLITTHVRIKSKAQFGSLSRIDCEDNDAIELGYGLGVGVFRTPYGRAFFKEGHDEGWGHYSVCFPDKKIAIVIMTNNDNGESIFKEILAYAIGDIYTPW